MRIGNGIFLLILFFENASFAQPWFKRNDTIEVSISANKLKLPWSGGLNFCQFSTIDLNQDGIKDLFIFDRCSPSFHKISTFINKGLPNRPDYIYAPEYRDRFPNMHDWTLLRDYNCDGKEDIFTYSTGGIAVYKNTSSVSLGLQFTLVTPLLYSNYIPNLINLYVSSSDLPSIVDMDNDGDLDILVFGVGSQSMEYHKNLSMEIHGKCDSLIYQFDQGCFGKFAKNTNNCTLSLNLNCRKGMPPLPDTENHKVSAYATCSLCLDIDGDGDNDVLVGDYSCNKLVLGINGGTPQSTLITAQDTTFPAKYTNTTPIDMVYPCGYYLDVDNDKVKDLIISPKSELLSNNFISIWYYKNKGQNNQPVFELIQKDFLQSEMIETGEGAYPVFFDYNADGLLDLLIGNFGYYAQGNYQSKISLYRNSGTASSPSFELITRDYAGLAIFNFSNLIPTFGDMDGDGDEDMLIGDSEGKLHYFKNTAGPGNPVNWGMIQPNYMGIDIGNYAAPQIIDVDRDGKKDIIIGGRNGKLSFYKNTGTISVPSFSLITTSFGGVNVTNTVNNTGYSYPFLFDQGGSYKLMVGSDEGWIHFYDNIDGNLSGSFTLVDSRYQNIWDGPRSAIHGADINNDGLLDLVLGNYGGGLSYFKGQSTNSIPELFMGRSFFEIFPNPAGEYLEVRFDEEYKIREKLISIIDLTGKIIYSTTCQISQEKVNLTPFSPGIYIIKVEQKAKGIASYKKVVIAR